MSRLRSNSQGGLVDVQVDTTAGGSFLFRSSALVSLPGLVSNGADYYAIIIDPDGEYGLPEIAQITAHPATALGVPSGAATPMGPTVTTVGTVGSTSYGYRVTALNGLGETLPSIETVIATGNPTLSATNYNTITWVAVPGASSYNVYGRSAGAELYMANVTATTYNDTGTVTPAGALPSVSTATPGIATIQAAQESTAGRIHMVGEPWVHGPTVYDTTTVRDVAFVRNAGATAGYDDEFNTGSLSSAWVRYDTSGTNLPVWTVGADVLSCSHLARSGGAVDNAGPAHCLLKPIGSLTFPLTIESAIRLFRHYATNYQMCGLIFTDGILPSSRGIWIDPFGSTATATAQQLRTTTYNRLDTGEITSYGGENWEIIGAQTYQRLVWTAVNTFRSYYSIDGVSWMLYPNQDIVTTIAAPTFTPTYMGVAISNWTLNQPCMASFEYFRVN